MMKKNTIYIMAFLCIFSTMFMSCKKHDVINHKNDIHNDASSNNNDSNVNNKGSNTTNQNQSDNVNKDENNNSSKNENIAPSNIIANRINLDWKSGINPIDFDIEPLLINGYDTPENKEKYTLDYILRFIDFKTLNRQTGNNYIFESNQLEKITLDNINVVVGNNSGSGYLEFSLKYNGTPIVYNNQKLPSLRFDTFKFFDSIFKPNKEYISTHFMSGCAEHFSTFVGNLISLNPDYYTLEEISASPQYSSNSINYSFHVHLRKGDKFIASYNSTLTGFRPISDITNVMRIEYSPEMRERLMTSLSRYIHDNNDYSDISKYIVDDDKGRNILPIIMGLANYVRISDNKNMPYYKDISDGSGYRVDVIQGGAGMLDFYMKRPIWELKKAYIKDHKIYLDVKLAFIDETSVNSDFSIVIPNVNFVQ